MWQTAWQKDNRCAHCRCHVGHKCLLAAFGYLHCILACTPFSTFISFVLLLHQQICTYILPLSANEITFAGTEWKLSHQLKQPRKCKLANKQLWRQLLVEKISFVSDSFLNPLWFPCSPPLLSSVLSLLIRSSHAPSVLPLFSEFFTLIFCPCLSAARARSLSGSDLRALKKGLRLIPNAKPQKIFPSLLFRSPLILPSLIMSWLSVFQTASARSGSHSDLIMAATITCH